MLDLYFESETRRRQLRRGPLAVHLDGLAAQFQRESYARNTAQRILSVVGRFNTYAALTKVVVEEIDERLVERFFAEELVTECLRAEGVRSMRHLLRYLREQGVIGPAPAPPPYVFASTLQGFDRYMRDVRGLAPTTRHSCLSGARELLDWLQERHREDALERLCGTDVLTFITEQVGRWSSQSWRGHLCSRVRGFLRYLQASGTVTADLTRAVPRVSTPRLARLPRGVGWEHVRALIDGVDTSHPDGLRDKALLLLLATLGLRSCEVRSLELGHIAWRAGEVRLPRTKMRRERILPLLPEVGAALADYVLHGRPVLAVPEVFLRHGPRPGPLKPNTVIWIVRRHLQRAGIRAPRAGAHMLRHSLATRMVNAGVPIKSVADVLGHASIDTTAIYTKVDENTLATVALPFPGGAR